MKNNILPNYEGDSIVNLMSSIAGAFGTKSSYLNLDILQSRELKKYQNIILFIVDGLGYEYLINKEKKTFLYSNLRGKMNSVFLPTTACAVTTFLTGDAPQQHSLTGWFINLKEVGTVSAILKFSPRVGGEQFSKQGIDIKDIIDAKSFTSKIKADNFLILDKQIADSDFSRLMSENSKVFGYNSIKDLFKQLKKAVRFNKNRKYIYTYLDDLDGLFHDNGTKNKKPEKYLKKLDKQIEKFSKEIKNTNTLLIVTADHGFVDVKEKNIINLGNHPILKDCLTTLICGESRTPHFYVRPNKVKQFEDYFRIHFSKYGKLFKGSDLIERNYYGLFKPNKKLFDRVGDYVFIFNSNYIFKDFIKKKKHKKIKTIGHHGGTSREEMTVPLILIKC
jgi:predicted AlkP superfamily pyrophosphatase or phosphodiesterase